MTEKAKRHDREETPGKDERLSNEESAKLAAEPAPEYGAQDALDDTVSSANESAEAVAETDTATEAAAPRPRARRTTRKTTSIEPAPEEQMIAQEPVSVTDLPTDQDELEAQGFTADEAQRLVDISIRLESSAEARASQAELKRLRFAQWLVEHGILDEFKA